MKIPSSFEISIAQTLTKKNLQSWIFHGLKSFQWKKDMDKNFNRVKGALFHLVEVKVQSDGTVLHCLFSDK